MRPKKLLTALAIATVVLIAGCKKDDYVEIEGICPLVISTNPTNGDVSVPLDMIITVTFNEAMNPATITQASFSLQSQSAKKSTAAEVSGTITYDELTYTASFTPSEPLEADVTYTGMVTSSVKDLMGNALQEDYVFTFSTGLTITPMVTITDPANEAVNVLLNKVINVTFNVEMDPLTITTSSFTVNQGTLSVPGTVSYSGTKASFNPTSDLTSNTIYTCTIKSSITNLDGNALQADYVWTFNTGETHSPSIISTDPDDNDVDVVLNKTVTANFNKLMDVSTITSTTFTISQGVTPVTGTVTYSGIKASFNPTSDFSINTIYTCTVKSSVADLDGNDLQTDYVWTFTTGSSVAPTVTLTDPVDLETSVPLNKVISATFSEAMNASTITSSSFILMLGSELVAGAVNYSGNTATFTPAVDLELGNYTATITTEVENLAGIPIMDKYQWTFSTNATFGTPFVDLNSVARFGIISGVGVSNNAGASEIHDMDVGIYPGARSSITGFPPGIIVNGDFYAADDADPVPAMLLQAKNDLVEAYLFAEGATDPAPVTVAGDIGGTTLAPGIYKTTSTLLIQSGNLTLDAQGDANAVWIFQIASDFTTVGGSPYPSPAGGNVILAGNAQAKNIFWQVGRSATIGDYTSFKGNILALTSLTMNAYSQTEGRMLCRNGAIELTSTNIINKP
ncbi:MAG TPA: hypothetical protein DCG75_02375 [Bacteroidales bacterium]|nr:hypothetical protein [Bacteroidales bacterium]